MKGDFPLSLLLLHMVVGSVQGHQLRVETVVLMGIVNEKLQLLQTAHNYYCTVQVVIQSEVYSQRAPLYYTVVQEPQ